MCLSWERTCDKMWLILCVCVCFLSLPERQSIPSRCLRYLQTTTLTPFLWREHPIVKLDQALVHLGAWNTGLAHHFPIMLPPFSHHFTTMFPNISRTTYLLSSWQHESQGWPRYISSYQLHCQEHQLWKSKAEVVCMDLIWFDWICGKCQTPKAKGILNSRVSWVDSLHPCSE